MCSFQVRFTSLNLLHAALASFRALHREVRAAAAAAAAAAPDDASHQVAAREWAAFGRALRDHLRGLLPDPQVLFALHTAMEETAAAADKSAGRLLAAQPAGDTARTPDEEAMEEEAAEDMAPGAGNTAPEAGRAEAERIMQAVVAGGAGGLPLCGGALPPPGPPPPARAPPVRSPPAAQRRRRH
eukprot:229288-Prorocentrum_minimum.AAC.2